jgi:hypothetical protein
MTSCIEWCLNELSSSYISQNNSEIVCQERHTVTLGQADIPIDSPRLGLSTGIVIIVQTIWPFFAQAIYYGQLPKERGRQQANFAHS